MSFPPPTLMNSSVWSQNRLYSQGNLGISGIINPVVTPFQPRPVAPPIPAYSPIAPGYNPSVWQPLLPPALAQDSLALQSSASSAAPWVAPSVSPVPDPPAIQPSIVPTIQNSAAQAQPVSTMPDPATQAPSVSSIQEPAAMQPANAKPDLPAKKGFNAVSLLSSILAGNNWVLPVVGVGTATGIGAIAYKMLSKKKTDPAPPKPEPQLESQKKLPDNSDASKATDKVAGKVAETGTTQCWETAGHYAGILKSNAVPLFKSFVSGMMTLGKSAGTGIVTYAPYVGPYLKPAASGMMTLGKFSGTKIVTYAPPVLKSPWGWGVGLGTDGLLNKFRVSSFLLRWTMVRSVMGTIRWMLPKAPSMPPVPPIMPNVTFSPLSTFHGPNLQPWLNSTTSASKFVLNRTVETGKDLSSALARNLAKIPQPEIVKTMAARLPMPIIAGVGAVGATIYLTRKYGNPLKLVSLPQRLTLPSLGLKSWKQAKLNDEIKNYQDDMRKLSEEVALNTKHIYPLLEALGMAGLPDNDSQKLHSLAYFIQNTESYLANNRETIREKYKAWLDQKTQSADGAVKDLSEEEKKMAAKYTDMLQPYLAILDQRVALEQRMEKIGCLPEEIQAKLYIPTKLNSKRFKG